MLDATNPHARRRLRSFRCRRRPGTARADDATALAFVRAIYAPYKGKNTNGVTLDTDADLRRYFEPSLVALISKDRKDAVRRHEVPTLDGDPFIDAQDWDISNFDIAVSDAGNGNATRPSNSSMKDSRQPSRSISFRSATIGGLPRSLGSTTVNPKPCAGYSNTE